MALTPRPNLAFPPGGRGQRYGAPPGEWGRFQHVLSHQLDQVHIESPDYEDDSVVGAQRLTLRNITQP